MNGALFLKPFCKLKHIRVGNEFLDKSESKLDDNWTDNVKKFVDVDDNLVLEGQDFHGGSGRVRVNIWKKSRGGAKTLRNKSKRNLDDKKNGKKHKREEKFVTPSQKVGANSVLDSQTVVDLDINAVKPELSPDCCNLILEQLEKRNDDKAVRFLEWMKVNGKLRRNLAAYNLIMRGLGRKGDLDGAELMIKERFA